MSVVANFQDLRSSAANNQNQDDYWVRFNQLEESYTHTAAKLSEAQELLARRQACGIELGRMRKAIKGLNPDTLEWDEALFHLITEKIVITTRGTVRKTV